MKLARIALILSKEIPLIYLINWAWKYRRKPPIHTRLPIVNAVAMVLA